MCLLVVYKGKQKREAIAKLPETFFVWKRARLYGVVYQPTNYGNKDTYYTGRQKASYLGIARQWNNPSCSAGYRAGWHCSRRRPDAAQWVESQQDVILRCRAYRRDIVAIGKQNTNDTNDTIVLTHLTFPKKCGQRPVKRKAKR